ncbi:MAG TPA: DUF6265 family protein [Ferruginibacter sp.]|nr:DUF6265 family protein [Ferruginibacter sp.]
MKKLIPFAICLVTCAAFMVAQPDRKKTFRQLHALEGTWLMKTKTGAVGERWKITDSLQLQSLGFRINGKDTVTTESVSLQWKDAEIHYTSTVLNQNNQEPIVFKMTSADKKVYIFENPEHDFPKRIVYRIISADSLHAYIDAGKKDPVKRLDFFYKKVKDQKL